MSVTETQQMDISAARVVVHNHTAALRSTRGTQEGRPMEAHKALRYLGRVAVAQAVLRPR